MQLQIDVGMLWVAKDEPLNLWVGFVHLLCTWPRRPVCRPAFSKGGGVGNITLATLGLSVFLLQHCSAAVVCQSKIIYLSSISLLFSWPREARNTPRQPGTPTVPYEVMKPPNPFFKKRTGAVETRKTIRKQH